MKCEKCGYEMTLRLVEHGEYFIMKIYRCTNLRCGYMFRSAESKK